MFYRIDDTLIQVSQISYITRNKIIIGRREDTIVHLIEMSNGKTYHVDADDSGDKIIQEIIELVGTYN